MSEPTTRKPDFANVLATFAGDQNDVITCYRIPTPPMMPAILHVNCRASGSAQVSWVYCELSGESGWVTSPDELEREIVAAIGFLQSLKRKRDSEQGTP